MGTFGVIQLLINIAFGVVIFFITMRITRQPKDDPRLSRGLQLLQAKISVLEDLSDRTEGQVNQMVAMLEQKIREVQNKIQLADRHVQLIRESMDRSLEVAKIFQDKIPHQEIIERQNTKKYLKAARMAHQGKTPQEIAAEVELSMGEIEFIAKVNREQLMFSEDQLPDWAREEEAANTTAAVNVENAKATHLANQQQLIENLQQVQGELDHMLANESVMRDYSAMFDVPKPATEKLSQLSQEFRKASQAVEPEAQIDFASSNSLSFVELTPPADMAEDFMAAAPAAPLLDLTGDEIASLKASVPNVPPQMPAAAKALSNQAASIQKTAAQVDAGLQYRVQAATSAIAQANAQARAQMMPEAPKAASPSPTVSSSKAQQIMQRAQTAPAKAAFAAPQILQEDPRASALQQARAAAQELRKPQPRAVINVGEAEVKRVEFPRIKSTDNLG